MDGHAGTFEASNGVKLLPGGYRHEDSRDAAPEAWLAAQAEARAAGFDLSFRAQRANAAKAPLASGASILPMLPAELEALPHGLGALQRWILGYMTYPSAACAGFVAIATAAHFAMRTVRIDSRDGLGVNEHFLLLAGTGFGKEDLRKPFTKLKQAIDNIPRPREPGVVWPPVQSILQFSAPASQQGLHRLLEQSRAQTFLADEFAEWLAHSSSDSHKQQALGHIMQAYTKAFSTLAAPAVADKEKGYQPVEGPRVLIFATSTPERMLEAITASQADRGALNRFFMLVAEQERIPKRYGVTAAAFEPPAAVVGLAAWLAALPDTLVTFAPDAADYRDAHDADVLEPLKFSDPRLAGRLNEQALKIAALVALSDRRTEIQVADLATAHAIREGLYYRAASLIGHDGALSGMHPTGQAFEQLRQRLGKVPFLYRSNLPKESRRFSSLSMQERYAVERALIEQGVAVADGAKFISQLFPGGSK